MIERPAITKPAPETVFIVDDDTAICEGLCNLLESVGLTAEHFPSAESFLQQWNGARAGCLVLDVRLPGMTGVEFQEKMQERGIEIPIIFMTAHGDIPMVRKVMKAGAVEFLTKPFEIQELLNAIEQAFARDRDRRMEEAILDGKKTAGGAGGMPSSCAGGRHFESVHWRCALRILSARASQS